VLQQTSALYNSVLKPWL